MKLVPYAEALATAVSNRLGNGRDSERPRSSASRVLRRFSARRDRRLHRLVAVLPDLGAEGQVPARSSTTRSLGAARPQAVRRRPASCSIASSTRSCSPPAASTASGRRPATATTSSSTPTNRARRSRCRFHTLRQQWERKGQNDFHSLADLHRPASKRPQRLPRRLRRHDRHRLRRAVPRSSSASTTITTRSWSKALADRLAEAFAEYLHAEARRDWGYGHDEQLDERRLDRGKVPRHPPRPRLSRPARPHREARLCSSCSTPSRPPASR